MKDIAGELERIDDGTFRAKCDAAQLKRNKIYPKIWDESGVALDDLARGSKILRKLFIDAAKITGRSSCA